MKITDIQLVTNSRPIPLEETFRPAWDEPDTPDRDSTGFGFYRVHTDEGITGIGPAGLSCRAGALGIPTLREGLHIRVL